MSRRKFDVTQQGTSDRRTEDAPSGGICENKLVYAERILALRKAAKLSQGDLAEAMGMGRAAISNWETGRTRPDIANIPRLCNALGVSVAAFFSDTPDEAGWNDAERALMRNYRKLSEIHQELLCATAQTMVDLEQAHSPAAHLPALLALPYADDSVAAGVGDSGFTASGHTAILHATPVTRRADMLFRVNGDSMEPAYPNHCTVLVKCTDAALAAGDVGIFQADGALYIKEYQPDGLHSLNHRFPVMRRDAYDEITTVGRVIGILPESDFATREEIQAFQARQD